MNNRIKLISVLALPMLLSSFAVNSQVKETWKQTLPHEVRWQKITALGDYVVGAGDQILGLDPSTGTIRWNINGYGDIGEGQIEEFQGSPYMALHRQNQLMLLDPYHGKIIFSSADAKISDLQASRFLYRAGILLVVGKNADRKAIMLGVDLANGGVAWRIEDDASRLVAAQELSDTESLIVTLFEIYRVETKSGNVKWKAPVSGQASAQLAKLGGLGAMLKQAADAQTEGMEFNVTFLMHAEKEAFFIGSEEQNSSMSGSTTPTYSCKFMYYSLADGKELWKQPAQMNGRLSHAVVESDGLIVLPDNGLITNVNKFDFATATGQWGKKGRGTRIKGGVYRFVETPKGYLLITSTGNNNFINFLDPTTGMLTFEKPVKIDGEVVGTATIANNIMYATSEETNMLDPSTGSLKFGKPVNAVTSMITENDDKIFLYDFKDGHIKTIDKTSGELSTLSKTPIKFEGKESPTAMELRENGIFIHSSQNVAMVGYEGQVVYQKFFPAPKEPGLTRALLYAQAVRAAYISAAASYASAAFTVAAEQSKQSNDQVGGTILGAVGEGYGQLGSAAGAFAVESFKRANARKKASSSGRDFMVIMTQEAKETLLIKVNKNTGSTDGKISLGKDNTPVYTVDDVTGQVFLKADKTNILSYGY